MPDRLAARTPWLVLAYFAMNAGLRTLTPGGLGLDEAEAMLHAQSFELAYGPQPPLYGWLQRLVFGVTGPGKLGLALLKNAILASAFLALWATARVAGADDRLAFAGVLAMALIPGITWEAQRALAHTPLALATASLALLAFTIVRRRGALTAHLLLGVALAAAGLAYWTTVFIGVGIVAALVFRRRAPWGHVAATLATATLLVAPTAIWYALHPDALAAASTRVTMGGAAPVDVPIAFIEGAAATLGVPLVVLGLLLARRPAMPGSAGLTPSSRTDLVLVALVGVVAFALIALTTQMQEVKERYFTALLFFFPLVVAACFAERLTRRRLSLLATLVGVVMFAVSAGLQWNWRLGHGEPPPMTAPFDVLAADLANDSDVLLVEGEWLAGNLLLAAPDRAIVTPENGDLRIDVAPPVRLVWMGPRPDQPPAALLSLFEERVGRPPDPGTLEAVARPWRTPRYDAGMLVLHTTLAR